MNSDQAARLRDWADDYVAGTLGQAEREALERELLTSAEARRFFLSYLELHAGLAWQFRGLECALPDLREVKPTRPSTSRRWRWSLSSAAAVLAVAAAVWLWVRGAPREPGADLEPVFAVVRETLRGRWRTGGKCVCPRASGEAVGAARADWFRSKELTASNCSSKDRRSPNLKTFIGIESHQRILDRLVAGDVAAATAELQKHIESHKERI